MKKTITSLKFWLMEALNTIETIKADMKAHKEGMEVGGLSSLD